MFFKHTFNVPFVTYSLNLPFYQKPLQINTGNSGSENCHRSVQISESGLWVSTRTIQKLNQIYAFLCKWLPNLCPQNNHASWPWYRTVSTANKKTNKKPPASMNDQLSDMNSVDVHSFNHYYHWWMSSFVWRNVVVLVEFSQLSNFANGCTHFYSAHLFFHKVINVYTHFYYLSTSGAPFVHLGDTPLRQTMSASSKIPPIATSRCSEMSTPIVRNTCS